MKLFASIICFLSTAGLLGVPTPVAAEPSRSPLSIIEQDEGFLFREGDRRILFYQLKPKSIHGKYERTNYIHPLYGLDGEVLTEDFPSDHLHQRGIYWAWHQAFAGEQRLGNSWALEDFDWDIRVTKILPTDEGTSALKVVADWMSSRWLNDQKRPKPFVTETTVVRVHRAEGGLRKIDFEIRLRALEDQLRLGGSEDDKGYGGFSARIRLPKDIEFLGRNGPVTPERTSVEAGPWLDFSGSFGASGGRAGLAILCHPSVPGFPQRWILRASGSMQNPVYPGRRPVLLPRDEPLVLRYRLIVHRGGLDRAQLDKLQAEYEASP